MSRVAVQPKGHQTTNSVHIIGILQRTCACGNHTHGGSECAECSKRKGLGLQTTLTINEPGDLYELEADRVANQVMAMPGSPAASGTPLRIQRSSAAMMDEVPASVAQALTSPGRPLEPAVQRGMEQRFGYDFSRVRVHADAAAAQSALHVRAKAYTVGRDIVFAAGRFSPETHEGRRLLAHELTHVVQQSRAPAMHHRHSADGAAFPMSTVTEQGSGGPSPGRVSIGRAPASAIQRDEEPKKLEKGLGKAVEKIALQAREQAKTAARAELTEIESNWKEMREAAADFSDVADWVSKGDTIIGLLRTHTELALDAIDKNDSALATFMTSIVESDMVMYRFVAWHVAIYVNLLSLEPQLKGLTSSFAADKRAFTGRDEAEEIVKLLTQLASAYRKQAPKWLELVKILPAEVSATSGRKIALTVTIAAHSDKRVSDLFTNETDKFIQDTLAVEALVGATNTFLDSAFKEGLVQAAEALVEYLAVRGGKRGGPKGSKYKKKKKKKEEKSKRKKCTDEEIRTLNAEMHKFCDKPRSCSMQGDTCASATAKVAAGQECVRKRTELQQRCFAPGDPGYATHMVQIAQASAALRECLRVMKAKC